MHAGLLAFYVLYLLVAFVWPTWRLWRVAGVNGLVLPRDDTAHGVVAGGFRLLMAALFLLLTLLALGLPARQLGPLPWATAPAIQVVGWIMLFASLAGIVIAQRQMGQSWRIGIDTSARPPLVQAGVFARSRNPIFLGMRINLLGLFLVLPNAFTLAALLLGEALIQVQVRLEEQHLSTTFGEAYETYRGCVRRWI